MAELEIICIQDSQDDAEWTPVTDHQEDLPRVALSVVTDIEMTVRADCAILPPPSLELPFKTSAS